VLAQDIPANLALPRLTDARTRQAGSRIGGDGDPNGGCAVSRNLPVSLVSLFTQRERLGHSPVGQGALTAGLNTFE